MDIVEFVFGFISTDVFEVLFFEKFHKQDITDEGVDGDRDLCPFPYS